MGTSGGPVCIRDVALDPELPRAKSAAKEGLHAAFAFPVVLKSGIVGVIKLFSRAVRDAEREREVLLRVTMANAGPMPQADLLAIYRRLMAVTRALEVRDRTRARAHDGEGDSA